ncbi:MAG: hypothetical protein AAFV95_04595 [Bacteroidota bacterium]
MSTRTNNCPTKPPMQPVELALPFALPTIQGKKLKKKCCQKFKKKGKYCKRCPGK